MLAFAPNASANFFGYLSLSKTTVNEYVDSFMINDSVKLTNMSYSDTIRIDSLKIIIDSVQFPTWEICWLEQIKGGGGGTRCYGNRICNSIDYCCFKKIGNYYSEYIIIPPNTSAVLQMFRLDCILCWLYPEQLPHLPPKNVSAKVIFVSKGIPVYGMPFVSDTLTIKGTATTCKTTANKPELRQNAKNASINRKNGKSQLYGITGKKVKCPGGKYPEGVYIDNDANKTVIK